MMSLYKELLFSSPPLYHLLFIPSLINTECQIWNYIFDKEMRLLYFEFRTLFHCNATYHFYFGLIRNGVL